MGSLIVGRTTHMASWATPHLQFMSQAVKLFFISDEAVSIRYFERIYGSLLPILDVDLLLFKAVELSPDHLHFLHLSGYYMNRQYSSLRGHADCSSHSSCSL